MNDSDLHTKTIIRKAWNPASARFEYAFEYVFRNKAEYLEFRRRWRQNYATLSSAIREAKASIKITMRKREYAGKLQCDLLASKAEAKMQLLMRAVSKQEASRQYLQNRRHTLPENG